MTVFQHHGELFTLEGSRVRESDLMNGILELALDSGRGYVPDEEEWALSKLREMGFAVHVVSRSKPAVEMPTDTVF